MFVHVSLNNMARNQYFDAEFFNKYATLGVHVSLNNKATNQHFDAEFFNKYATLEHYLSRGASGSVYGPIKWNGTRLAIKQVMFADGKVTKEFRKDLERKTDIWTSLGHTNLMRIHFVELSQLPKVMFSAMDFAAGGSLHKTLRSLGPEKKLPIDIVADWTNQITEGMRYLHERNIVHRDLKSPNSE